MTLTIRNFFDLSDDAPASDDPFASFGEAQSPAFVGHSSNRFAKAHEADLSPLEKKMRERQRLSAAYKAARQQEAREILAGEPRLSDFLRYLRKVGLHQAGELVEAVEACDWLRASPVETRLFALRAIERRCDRLNRSLGIEPLDDDPFPTSQDVRSRCRALLYAGGRG